jgi:hypothetical protein
VPEVFQRIGAVLDPPPEDFASEHRVMKDWVDPLRTYTEFYLKRHRPTFMDPANGHIFDTAFTIARLWAEINAERVTNSRWPPERMFGKDGQAAADCLDAMMKEGKYGPDYDWRRMKDWRAFARSSAA